jgi:hypothetical protein
MRLTIVAGLIMGVSLAVQSAVDSHQRAKAVHATSAVRAHEREVAPWYIAMNPSSDDLPLPVRERQILRRG